MFKRLRLWWERRRAMTDFNCAFWCPSCNEEQHYHASREWENGDRSLGIIVCRCNCGAVSRWYWGAPVPLLLPEETSND